MLDLVKLMPHLTPSRLWKGTQIVECATTVFAIKQTEARITELTARLIALEREGADVVAEINTLRSMRSEETEPIKVAPSGRAGDPTDLNSPIEKKHALFRGLFCGRSDVYPYPLGERYDVAERLRTACANEWRRGICEKPRVKCLACPNQAFVLKKRLASLIQRSWASWLSSYLHPLTHDRFDAKLMLLGFRGK